MLIGVWHWGWLTVSTQLVVALPLPLVQVWGAGGSLKVTILQSSDSRAFSTVSVAPGPRSGDSPSATSAAAASVPSEQAPQFFCYICRASCCGQQVLPPGPGRWAGCMGWVCGMPTSAAACAATWGASPLPAPVHLLRAHPPATPKAEFPSQAEPL